MQKIMYDDTIVKIEEELRCVCTKIKREGRKILSDLGITPPQFEALQHLIKENSLTISELSKKMHLACSTITDLVTRMEQNGLVQRNKSTKDLRIIRIVVQEKGYQIIKEVLIIRRNYLSGLLGNLEQEQKKLLTEGINIIYNRIM
ncbi:MAG: MarR family transcriptional regulator [Clostridiales bacterium]|nr:MarR family transcriptional regulator [Clostridiales bacterium]